MCGIAGFCEFRRDNRTPEWGEAAFAMGETLRRRGPDDDGVWQCRECAFAHRRLAVIDPEHGSQPMVRTLPGGECALCYNGELYNTPQLRRELEERGVALETWSDTEVLLWQCILFGAAAVEKLEGIFAFAFWDGRSRTLLLARDRQAAVLRLSGHHAGVRQRAKSAVRLPGAHAEGGHRELAGGAGPVPRPDAGARRICRGAGAAGRPSSADGRKRHAGAVLVDAGEPGTYGKL